jgi:hypothetical protein
MKPPRAKQGAPTDERRASANSARCALCGITPPQTESGALRQLGTAPVVITVCADADACVTRWMSANG